MMHALIALLLLAPLGAHAQSFKELVNSQVLPLGEAIVSLFYVLAFLFFLIGMLRFFYAQGEEERSAGKQHMLWGILGLVVMFSVWGLVKLLLSVLPGAS